MAKRRRRGFRGLSGSSSAHAHEASIALHYASRPFIDGCSRSLQMYGAAKAHLKYVEDEAQQAELKRALRRASGVLEVHCSCAYRGK